MRLPNAIVVLAVSLLLHPCMPSELEAVSPNAETVTIPLDEIWALDMPGTREVRELEPDVYGKVVSELSAQERDRRFNDSVIHQVVSTLDYLAPWKNQSAAPGFAVAGTGMDALEAAHRVLVKKEKPQNSFSTDTDISLVFFSHSFGSYVHIHKVERQGNVINIQYSFVPHRTKEMTRHFALIPLGELKPGKFDVKIAEREYDAASPARTNKDRIAEARRVVCRSFSFTVVEGEE